MKLTINTTKLQEMLSKASKGAGNNKLIPLTGLMAIRLTDRVLTITTTDGTNYLYVRESNIDGDDFYTVVQVDIFAKLIARMTCESITLDLQDSYLTVLGNGTYKLEIPLDDEGSVVEYPNPAEMFAKTNKIGVFTLPTVKTILTSVKPALMTTNEYPWYTCYHVSDAVVATDTYKINRLGKAILSEPKLISAEQMNLLDVMTADEIAVYSEGDKMLFDSDNCTIYAVETPDIDEFNIVSSNSLALQSFGHMCKLSRDALINLFDRISLFVGAYDNGAITLTFTADGVIVTSKAENGAETIPYVESKDFTDFVCSVNINMMMSQIKAQSSDSIELWYGDDSSIKLVDGDLTAIIALLTD